ncbi:GNAT family N-acetyltransferase [Streptomyces sp. NPDC001902]|nr:GNAT family N-acetyltransferase [Streptomyces sp. PA03-1a]MDX2704747.1 GNAT family N-acetyltransferase [Streptomyces sp. PA03-6a]MDX2813955.1 GNAT family N-acetyltransferase [Streptomyces sp. PA03-5A]
MIPNAAREDGRLVLTHGRVVLREQLPEEAAQLADGKPAGLEWIDGGPGEGTIIAAGMMTIAAAAAVYAPGWGLFVIQRTDDGLALGGIGFHGPPSAVDGLVEIGYDLSESARGVGWATDAVLVLSRWALSRAEVRTVLATTDPGNRASQRVLERAGFGRVADRDAQWAYELRPAGVV